MRIGAVATGAHVNEQTLRYYERAGLVPAPARSSNGYREYPDHTVALVRFIKRAQELGFSLEEAKALSDLRRAPGRNRLKVRALAEAKLQDINRKIVDLIALRRALKPLVTRCCQNNEPRCPIIEALDGSVPFSRQPLNRKDHPDETIPPDCPARAAASDRDHRGRRTVLHR